MARQVFSRRGFIENATAFALTAGAIRASAAQGQSFPSRPIRVVFPFTAGGGPDTILRLIANKVEQKTGATVIIENKPGGGGSIGTTYVRQASADGYTLMQGSHSTHATNPSLYKNIGYDPQKDFEPITLLFVSRTFLLVPSSLGVNSVKELREYAKQKQGGITYASPGIGSGGHLGGAMLGQAFGLTATHVPYRGSAPTRTDLLAGRVDLLFNSFQPFIGDLEAGTVKALAIAHRERFPGLPNVPTMAEEGYPGIEIHNWFGLFAPARVPLAMLDKLNDMFAQAANDPELTAAAVKQGFLTNTMSRDGFRSFVKDQIEYLGKIVRDLNIQI
jgi:tripartite-type tricarboxylate transporter receptor subunit TctC